jgi:hypothetical protein
LNQITKIVRGELENIVSRSEDATDFARVHLLEIFYWLVTVDGPLDQIAELIPGELERIVLCFGY